MTPINIDYAKVSKFCIASALFLSVGVNLAQAAPTPSDREEQNRRARQEAQEREQRQQQKDVFTPQEKKSDGSGLPEEALSFPIERLVLEGEEAQWFSWVQDMLNQYNGRKIGIHGINKIVKRVTDALISRGYITTRILVPQQDLSQGTLRFILVPGKIHDIRFKDPSFKGNWQNAFPTRPGEILNLRNLEQGLEQMKRVSSQDVNFELVPGQKAGESDVVITGQQTKPWRFALSADDSGNKATGKLQFSQMLAIDNLLNSNDILQISLNGNAERSGETKGTHSRSLSYSIPYGRTLFNISTTHNRFKQTIAGINQTFVFSGVSDNTEFRLSQLLQRDSTSKTHLNTGIIFSNSKNFLNDAEIEVQRKNTTAFEYGLSHRQYFGQAVWDISLDNKIGVPWFQSQELGGGTFAGMPTTRYHIWLLDTGYTTPLTIGKTKAQYRLNFKGQYTKDGLYGSEQFSIGNRYTVRGFDGEQTLTGEQGWYVQNELSFSLADTGNELYLGIDHGEVAGPSTEDLSGKSLTGLAIGFRGSKNRWQYDVFIGWPLQKPQKLSTANPTLGFYTSLRL